MAVTNGIQRSARATRSRRRIWPQSVYCYRVRANACSKLAWPSCCSCRWRALRFHISPRRTLGYRRTSLPHRRAYSYWRLGSCGPSSISVLQYHASHFGFHLCSLRHFGRLRHRCYLGSGQRNYAAGRRDRARDRISGNRDQVRGVLVCADRSHLLCLHSLGPSQSAAN